MIWLYKAQSSDGTDCEKQIFETLGEEYKKLCSWIEGCRLAGHYAVFDVDGRAVHVRHESSIISNFSKVEICGADKTEIEETRKTIDELFKGKGLPIKLKDV